MKPSHLNQIFWRPFRIYAPSTRVLVTSYFKSTKIEWNYMSCKTACTDNSTLFLKFTLLGVLVQLEKPFKFITCTFGKSAKICTTKTDFLVPQCKGSQVVQVKGTLYFWKLLHSMKWVYIWDYGPLSRWGRFSYFHKIVDPLQLTR